MPKPASPVQIPHPANGRTLNLDRLNVCASSPLHGGSSIAPGFETGNRRKQCGRLTLMEDAQIVMTKTSSGCTLVVKVTDSWMACHEFEPCTAEDPPCRGGRCTLNMKRLKRPPVGEV
ncbi:hypothetical protein TNCV_4605891 [Trichonephila clavipes]|nr:hypothetical protein TNCV_4605891 [Trichonephila clavipes]